MTEPQDPFAVVWWAAKLDDLDQEIARLAQLCQVRILDPGVIERVVRKDARCAERRIPWRSRNCTTFS